MSWFFLDSFVLPNLELLIFYCLRPGITKPDAPLYMEVSLPYLRERKRNHWCPLPYLLVTLLSVPASSIYLNGWLCV